MAAKVVRRALLVAAVVIGVVLIWGSWAAIRTRGDVLAARRVLTSARDNDTQTEQVRAALDQAHHRLRSGRARMRQPGPRLAARLPFVGRSFAAVGTTATAADAVVVAARSIILVTESSDLLSAGAVNLTALDRLRVALEDGAASTAPSLRRLRSLRTGLTPGAVGRGVAEARAELGGVDDDMRKAARALDALGHVLGRDGPQRVLFVLENNSELRATGGLISVFAEATATDGRLVIRAFRDVEDVAASGPSSARRVPAPPDYVRLYGGFLGNSTLWKNVNMSPEGPSSWQVLANVADRSLGRRPAAIVAIDVPGVAEILAATGPVELPDGRTLTAANAVRQLLVESYAGVPDDERGQDERRRRLRVAADAVIGRLLSGSPSPVRLSRALQRATAGRHLMVWAADAATQDALATAGIAGAVPGPQPDIAMMTVHNLGSGERAQGNKLDFYAHRSASVRVVVDRQSATTTQRFTLRNDAPERGLSAYVAGRVDPGRTNNLVTFAVPPGAELTEFRRDGLDRPRTIAHEGGHGLLTDIVSLDPGDAATWTIGYRVAVPSGRYGLALVPQPVARAAHLELSVTAADGVSMTQSGRGATSYTGKWDAVRQVRVEVPSPGWWDRTRDRARRFWEDPVRIG